MSNPIQEARKALHEVKQKAGAASEAAKPIDGLVRDAIVELGSNPETDAITHAVPVDGCWVEVKVERIENEDAGPEYDTVSQNDIRVGDIVEWHDDCGARRWEVMSVSDWTGAKAGVILQSLHAPLYATQHVKLPLPGDPFILRPRSS